MACTLSNRETFAVYNWLSGDFERLERFRSQGQKWKGYGIEFALPRLSNMIYEELSAELPQLDGVAKVIFEGGLSSRQFLRAGACPNERGPNRRADGGRRVGSAARAASALTFRSANSMARKEG